MKVENWGNAQTTKESELLMFNFQFQILILYYLLFPGIENWKLKVENWKCRQSANDKRKLSTNASISNLNFNFQLLDLGSSISKIEIENWKVENWKWCRCVIFKFKNWNRTLTIEASPIVRVKLKN